MDRGDSRPVRPAAAAQLITRIDNKKLHSEMCDIDWSVPLTLTDPNDIVNYIHIQFYTAYSNCTFTVNSRSKRKTCTWANLTLKNMCIKRDELYNNWLLDENNDSKRLAYNTYRNKTNKYTQYVKNRQIKSDM